VSEACVLLVEADILVRHPLAEYLRECGYTVLEAANTDDARKLMAEGPQAVDAVLADVDVPGEGGFALAAYIRANHPGVQVILAGSVAKATAAAGDLCEEGPSLAKPYDHQFVHDRIRRLLAARDRNDCA
jgi:DNA-binding response OmpR family regulator